MAQELDEQQVDIPNPDQPEWYEQTLKDIQGLPETEEPSTPSLAEREASVAPTDGNTTAADPEEQALTPYRPTKNKGKLNNKKRKRNRNLLIVGGGGGLVAVVIGLAALPTLLMNTITQKLNDTFIGRAQYAIERRVEVYVNRYVNNVIGGSMRTCGTYISKDCAAVAPNRNKSLYATFAANWRDNRIETKLYNKYGIEFRLNSNNPNAIEVFKNGDLLGDFGKRSVAREVLKSVDAETKYKGILARRHIKGVLSRKYGADKYCFIACKQRDDFDSAKIRAIDKIKLRMVARVAEISSARTTALLLCISTGCNNDDLRRQDKQLLDKILKKTDQELIQGVLKDFETYQTKDLTQLIVRKTIGNLLEKFGYQKAAQLVTSYIPVVGQIYLGATIAEFVTTLDDWVKDKRISKFLAEVYKQEAAVYATQIQVMSEDIQSGEASVADSLGVFEFLNGAGKSRLWQEMNGVENKSSIQCEEEILDNPNDPLVCPELKVQRTLLIENIRNNPIVNAAFEIGNRYDRCYGVSTGDLGNLPVIPDCAGFNPRSIVKPTLEVINSFTGAITSGVLSVLESIPLVGGWIEGFQNFITQYAEQFFTFIAKKIFGSPIDYDAVGFRAFDQAAMGYDVIGNTFAKGDPNDPEMPGLGAVVVDAKEQVELDIAIREMKKEYLQTEGVFARYFNIKDPSSLASNSTTTIAMNFSPKTLLPSIGSGVGDLYNNIASLLPFGATASASLNPQDRVNLFNVTQYAYPVNSRSLDVDPDELTPEACAQFKAARLASGYENTVTGEIDYTVDDPCELDSTVTDSLTKIYNLDSEGSGGLTAPPSANTSISYPGLNGYAVPCDGIPTPVRRIESGGSPRADWNGIADSGQIGTGSDGTPIKVYIREACPGAADVKTIFLASSIHGSENGGQLIMHELLFNIDLPDNIRIIAVPEINKHGILFRSQNGYGGRVNANGVNLNRNFDYNWSSITEGEGTDNYRGVSVASEPETQALVNFVNALEKVDLAIHYHDNIRWVAAVGNSTPLSLATAYAGIALDTPLRPAEGGRVFQKGSFDAWQNTTKGTPALLVEMGQDQSTTIINSHVQAVKTILESGAL